jgi:hypothetical protein
MAEHATATITDGTRSLLRAYPRAKVVTRANSEKAAHWAK